MIVNVCPASVTSASPDRVWEVLTNLERFGDWNDATYVSSEPAGPISPGQVVRLTAPALGRAWPVIIEVGAIDPARRWIDLLIRLPLGVRNHEHVTLTETESRGTLVRFN
ncbi:MAG: SRPBCC family protein [Candidatus Dormibacterales bacterium]